MRMKIYDMYLYIINNHSDLMLCENIQKNRQKCICGNDLNQNWEHSNLQKVRCVEM